MGAALFDFKEEKIMKKMHEMSMGELAGCIGKIAKPAERLFSDNAVIEALKTVRETVHEGMTMEAAFSLFVSILFPVLTDGKHKKDSYAIVTALSDAETAVEDRNGLEVMRDMFMIFLVDKDVESIFRPCIEARGK